MEFAPLLPVLASAAILGSCYVLLSVGYAINARVQRFFDVSQGAAITTAVYASWGAQALGSSAYVTVLVGLLVGAVTGACFCRLRITLETSDTSPLQRFLAAFGYLIAIEGILGLIAGGEVRVYSMKSLSEISVGPIKIGAVELMSLIMAILVWCGASLSMAHTQLGRKMRAVESSPALARISGLNVPNIQLTASAVGGAISGLAGVLYAWPRTGYPSIGLSLIIAPLTISIVGSRVSWTALGAIAIAYGVLETLVFMIVPGEWKQSCVFLILILVLAGSTKHNWVGNHGLRKT